MDINELLQEAELRYPVGTTYWNLDMVGNRSNTKPGSTPITNTKNSKAKVAYEEYKGSPIIERGDYQGYIYAGGKWAEIVSSPHKIYELWM